MFSSTPKNFNLSRGAVVFSQLNLIPDLMNSGIFMILSIGLGSSWGLKKINPSSAYINIPLLLNPAGPRHSEAKSGDQGTPWGNPSFCNSFFLFWYHLYSSSSSSLSILAIDKRFTRVTYLANPQSILLISSPTNTGFTVLKNAFKSNSITLIFQSESMYCFKMDFHAVHVPRLLRNPCWLSIIDGSARA